MSAVSVDERLRKNFKTFGNHDDYLSRITKTLYYVKLPKSECTSLPVTELAAEIFSDKKNRLSLEYLDTEEAANLSCNACVSPCSLVLALLYLDRLKSSNPKYLAKVSPSELFLISLMIGTKFLQDDGEEDEVNNDEWASSAGISVQDINRAEKEFLKAIDWEVYVSEELFWKHLRFLEQKVGLQEGCKRGWFTYTDLEALLELVDITNLLSTLLTVTAVSLTSYTVSVLTIVGSVLLVGQIPCLGLNQSTKCMGYFGPSPTDNIAIISNDKIYNTQMDNILNHENDNLTILSSLGFVNYTECYSSVVKSCSSQNKTTDRRRNEDNSWISRIPMTWRQNQFNLNTLYSTLPLTDFLYDNFIMNRLKHDIRIWTEPFGGWADIVKNCLSHRSLHLDLFPVISY